MSLSAASMSSDFSKRPANDPPRDVINFLSSPTFRRRTSSSLGAGSLKSPGSVCFNHAPRWSISCGQDECAMPAYVRHSIASLPIASTSSLDLRPRSKCTTMSPVPCAQKSGALMACSLSARPSYSLRSVSHELSTTAPPNLRSSPAVSSVRSAMAPPCENPPTTTRSGGMPAATSRRASSSIQPTASSMSSLASCMFSSSPRMSNQEGIDMPMLSVTACVGAFGKTQRMWGRLTELCRMSAQPWLVSPRP
mmetsp:Transcript_5672/g.17177  ORF Transcript_5672/g.17177 Transcript_5672/m.17177 type:complete len:251 (+) Transcript_5672:96-848(+)